MRPIGTACYFNGHIKTDCHWGTVCQGQSCWLPSSEDRRPVLGPIPSKSSISDALHGDACCDLFLHLEFGRWHVD